MATRVQFMHMHVRYTVLILEEGNLHQPRCPQCEIMVIWKALNGRRFTTAHCSKGVERKRHRLEAEEMMESATREF